MHTLKEIAQLVNGKLIGDEHYKITSPAKIEDAQAFNISFLANEKYLPFIETTNAGAIILSQNSYKKIKKSKLNFIVVDDAYTAFTILLQEAEKKASQQTNIHQPNFKVGKNTQIYPNVYIGENVEIGDDCIVYPNVVIYKNCKIGNNCILHAGVVIGSDGFGFAPQQDGSFKKIPQLGNVILEDDCEIGANTCIDRATLGSTIIRKGVKLDNLIQVGHNVEIGEYTVIAAQTGISGSTKIGHHAMIGGQVGFVGHITIAPNTKINAKSAIASSIKTENQVLSGIPAFDIKQHFRSTVVYKNLPELDRKIRMLEQEISRLKENK